MAGLARLLFPATPRDFPGQRGVKIALRAVHVLCAGVLTGSYLLEAAEAQRRTWLVAAIASGVVLLLFDLFESGAFLVQVRGAVVLIKLALVAALPHLGEAAGEVLAAVVLASVVFSHAPARVRYHQLALRGRVTGSRKLG